jgi:hypothetical protein
MLYRKKRWGALLLIGVLFLCCARREETPRISGPYLGQAPPGNAPELFAPHIVSTELDELNAVFSPDLREFYFCVRQFPNLVSIFQMKEEGGSWSYPRMLPFASRYGDIDVTLSPDGNKILFSSRRPLKEGDPPREDYDFWMAERMGDDWGEAGHLGDAINSGSNDFYPMMAAGGALYFSSQREGAGTNNIYRSALVNGRYGEAEKLGPEINTQYREFDPYVSPDESILIFTSERPEGLGRGDLYISFRLAGGGWSAAVNMGEPINSPGPEFCAMLSPDGKYLFFTSARRQASAFPEHPVSYETFIEKHGMPQNVFGDIYWVDSSIIDELRQLVLK